MKTAVDRGGGGPGTIVPKCPHCGGRVEPKSNGNGSVADRCTSCGRSPDATPATAAAARAPRFEVAAGSACRVKDCPGTVDGSGRRACCERRAKWAEENVPKRECRICHGRIGQGARELCKACRPIVQRAQIAKHHAEKAKATKK
jgi:hypothetical protein